MAKIQVLLVDDNLNFHRAMVEFLGRCPDLAVVGRFFGPENILGLAQDLQPDVILVDLDRPDLAGLKAVPWLRRALPQAGIIALSLSGESAYREAALAAGADDLVGKAELATDLLPAVRRLAQRVHGILTGLDPSPKPADQAVARLGTG